MPTAPRLQPVYASVNRPLTIGGADRRLFFVAVVLGGATFTFFGSLLAGLVMFLTLYLAGKVRLYDHRGHAASAWLIFFPMMGAALVAISRLEDYRHHDLGIHSSNQKIGIHFSQACGLGLTLIGRPSTTFINTTSASLLGSRPRAPPDQITSIS